jgi:glycine betaine/proline transport system substrate-binding protein
MKKQSLYALALTGAMLPMAANAECGEVSIAQMDWASGSINANVMKILLTQGYGCDVTLVPSATTTAVASVAENNEPDVIAELWMNSAPSYKPLEEEGKVETASDAFSNGGTEGWFIPAYLAEEHPELTTAEGIMNNPELVGGRFNSCPDGWGCRFVNDSLSEAFDMEGNGLEVFHHGSGETMGAAMVAAYENREPHFTYWYGPTSQLALYDWVRVDIGPYKPEVHTANQNPDTPVGGISDLPPAPIVNAVTTDFAESEPEAYELVSNVTFPNEVMLDLMKWHTENSASYEEAAVRFFQAHKDVWSTWVSDEAMANLDGLF